MIVLAAVAFVIARPQYAYDSDRSELEISETEPIRTEKPIESDTTIIEKTGNITNDAKTVPTNGQEHAADSSFYLSIPRSSSKLKIMHFEFY